MSSPAITAVPVIPIRKAGAGLSSSGGNGSVSVDVSCGSPTSGRGCPGSPTLASGLSLSGRTNMGTVEVPVLIVGGGGCGLSASVFLSDHGVGHLLVGRHADTSTIPKAHYLNQRTMEIFRQHGLHGEVAEKAAPLEKFGKLRWLTSRAGDGALDTRLIHAMDAFGSGARRETHAAARPALPAERPQRRLAP